MQPPLRRDTHIRKLWENRIDLSERLFIKSWVGRYQGTATIQGERDCEKGASMKKTLLLSVCGFLVAVPPPSHGQGYIVLDNYNTSGPRVTCWALPSGYADDRFTIGFYYALGDVVASVPSDPTGIAIPGGPLVLATGPGSTTGILGKSLDGFFDSDTAFEVPGSSAGDLVTLELIVYYGGSDYASSLWRGLSPPFVMVTKDLNEIFHALVGSDMPGGWGVESIEPPPPRTPEPSSFPMAVLGIGALSILTWRDCHRRCVGTLLECMPVRVPTLGCKLGTARPSE